MTKKVNSGFVWLCGIIQFRNKKLNVGYMFVWWNQILLVDCFRSVHVYRVENSSAESYCFSVRKVGLVWLRQIFMYLITVLFIFCINRFSHEKKWNALVMDASEVWVDL